MGFFGPTKQSKKSQYITLNQLSYTLSQLLSKIAIDIFVNHLIIKTQKQFHMSRQLLKIFLKPSRRTKNKNVEEPSPKIFYIYT